MCKGRKLLFTRPNVETIVSLSKNFAKPKEYVQIGIDAEDYYRIKDSEKKEDEQ